MAVRVSRVDLLAGASAESRKDQAEPVQAEVLVETGWSQEAEWSVLGSVILAPEMLPEVEQVVSTDDFYSERNRTVWSVLLDMVDRRLPVDLVILFQELRAANLVERAGGPEYLARLTEYVPTPVNAVHYARVVRDYSVRRRSEVVLRQALQQVQSAAPGHAVEEVQVAQAALYAAVERCGSTDAPVQVKEGLRGFFQQLEERMRGGQTIAGISTGFLDLDQIMGGLMLGTLTILAARPSMGKSSLGKDFALAAAFCGHPSAVFPVEDGRERLVARCVSSVSGVAAERIRTGQVDEEQFQELFRAGDELSRLPLWIDNSPRLTTNDVRRRLMGLRRVMPVQVCVVDYLQKLTPVRYHESREREVSEMVGELKAIAREVDCAMVVLAQLNRKLEERANKRPMLSDLRESGAIEQDADGVLFVYRDEVYDQNSKDRGTAEVIVAKGRDSGLGTARLRWDPSCVRFQNLAREGEGQ